MGVLRPYRYKHIVSQMSQEFNLYFNEKSVFRRKCGFGAGQAAACACGSPFPGKPHLAVFTVFLSFFPCFSPFLPNMHFLPPKTTNSY